MKWQNQRLRSTIHVFKLKKVRKLWKILLRVCNVWARPEVQRTKTRQTQFCDSLQVWWVLVFSPQVKRMALSWTPLSVLMMNPRYGLGTWNVKLCCCTSSILSTEHWLQRWGTVTGLMQTIVVLFEVWFSHFPGGTKQNHENSQNSQCCCRDSNRASIEYKCTALPLSQPAQCEVTVGTEGNQLLFYFFSKVLIPKFRLCVSSFAC
jgi:hypothetical protein